MLSEFAGKLMADVVKQRPTARQALQELLTMNESQNALFP